MSTSSNHLHLFALQAEVYQRVLNRLNNGKPTILWAGLESGKSTICAAVSHTLDYFPQIVIGQDYEAFEGFSVDYNDYARYDNLPLSAGNKEGMWRRITPMSTVFMDDVFNTPAGRLLYDRVCSITPRVVAMACEGVNDWWGEPYLGHYVGPFATWELNPLYSEETLRSRYKTTRAEYSKFSRTRAAALDKWW